jgi:hypothetical protein
MKMQEHKRGMIQSNHASLCYGLFGVLFAVTLVGYGELLTAFGATGREYTTAVSCSHALTETVLVVPFAIVRLECSFHDCILFCFISAFA